MYSEEDVLCSVNHVKYKKDEGTLYVMSQRLAWIQENRDTVSVSHLYADIKSQKISPEGKPKIQLQIVLNDATTFTFQFVHPGGPPAQHEARNQIKEHLIALLPKFKRKINPELEEKNKLLVENPGLMQLYRDLVMNGILTSEEFWKNHVPKFIAEKPVVEPEEDDNPKELLGISSGFLAGIQPTNDGVNGMVYNLTWDLMSSIFRTYPAVHKKYKENVPALMRDQEFWHKFSQSHYFHRDRIPVSKDLFYSCSKADDKGMKKQYERLRQQRPDIVTLFDDSENQESHSYNMHAVDEGEEASRATPHQHMIKRFNQHSIMLLKASLKPRDSLPEDAPPVEPEKKKKKKDKDEIISEPEREWLDPAVLEAHEAELQKKIELEDLMPDPETAFTKMHLTNIGRYLNGPVPVYQNDPITLEEIQRSCHALREAAAKWSGKPYLLDGKMAAQLINDLSPGGAIMKTNARDTASLVLSPEVETEIRNTYRSLAEILHPFWHCFPITTRAGVEKVKRCHETVKKFEQIKFQQLKDRLQRDHLPATTMMRHLHSMIEAVDVKYNRWLSTLTRPKR